MQSRTTCVNRLTVFALVLLICASVATAQRPEAPQARPAPVEEADPADGRQPPPGTDPARRFMVFRLEHSTANAVVLLLESVLPSLVRSEDLRLAPDSRSNSILVAGTDEALEHVAVMIRELDVPEGERDPAAEVKVFQLQNVRAREAAETLRSLYVDQTASPFGGQRGGGSRVVIAARVAIAADEQSNTVIVKGDREILQAIEGLLLHLDESRSREESPQTHVVGLQGAVADADSVAETLRKLGVSRVDVEVVPGSKGHQILLRGDRKSVAQASQLLSKLYEGRRPQADEVRLRVVWLVSPGLAGEDAADPPKNLDKVLNALKSKAGVGELKMAAQFFLNARRRSDDASQQHFVATGTPAIQSGSAAVRIDGQFEQSGGTHPRLQIQIEAQRRGERVSQELCRLSTTVSAPPSHPVVLGMTPIDSMDSVFVIEILPPDQPDVGAEAIEPKPAGGTAGAP